MKLTLTNEHGMWIKYSKAASATKADTCTTTSTCVWHLSFPLINRFNKTEAAVFPCRLCFLRAFLFISLIKHVLHCFRTGHFVMVPINLTCLHCLQHFLFENLFNLHEQQNRYYKNKYAHFPNNRLSVYTRFAHEK